MTDNQRADLVSKIASAATLSDRVAAVQALDAFDRGAIEREAIRSEIDLANTGLAESRRTVVTASGQGTLESDWLTEYNPGTDLAQARASLRAEAGLWFERTAAVVKADPMEFGEQAEGFVRHHASAYGADADALTAETLTYVGFLWRQAASGLPQIQQTVDSHDNPAPTPLPEDVFDNFAPPVAPENEGVVGTETSERAPQMQDARANAAAQGQAEQPSFHSEGPDYSGSYSDVPAGGDMNAASGPLAPMEDADQDLSGWTREASLFDDFRPVDGLDEPIYTTTAAVNHTETLEQVWARMDKEAASGLPQIQQTVDAEENPAPTPLPQSIMFPWLISPNQSNSDGESQKTSALDDHNFQESDHVYGGDEEPTRGMQALHDEHGNPKAHTAICDNCENAMDSVAGDEHGLYEDVENPRHSGLQCQNCGYDPADGEARILHHSSRKEAAHGLAGMPDGAHWNVESSAEEPWEVRYNSEQALGDNGMPARGYTVGTYSVTDPHTGDTKHFRHTPHGPGLSGAKGAAADDAMAHINRVERARRKQGREGSRKTARSLKMYHDAPHARCSECGQAAHHDIDAPGRPVVHNSTGKQECSSGQKQGSRRTADQWNGQEETPHHTVGENVANDASTATPPVGSGSYGQGVQDAHDSGQRANWLDNSSSIPSDIADYSKGYSDGIGSTPGPERPEPYSMSDGEGGEPVMDATVRTSSKFTDERIRSNADYRKGYRFASKWAPGGQLVNQGTPEFEAGLFAGITDRPEVREAWRAAHRRQAAKGLTVLAQRIENNDAYVDYLQTTAGIDVTAASPAESYTRDVMMRIRDRDPAGQENPADGATDAHRNWAISTYGPRAWKHYISGNWDQGHYASKREAGTSAWMNPDDGESSPSATGQTPFNGPGTEPVLQGEGPINAPAGPAPYNGAPPFGKGVVPTGPAAVSTNTPTVQDLPGGPVDQNLNLDSARTAQFRRTVQANLLAANQKGHQA